MNRDRTMDPQVQNDKATAFRGLHEGPKILVLPNAWDAASAPIFEGAGFTGLLSERDV